MFLRTESSKIRTIRQYYRLDFPLDEIEQLFGDKFEEREFGFAFADGYFVRSVFFRKSEELLNFLVKKTPHHAYVGALYDGPQVSKKTRFDLLRWKGREFVIDLDIDLQQWRICGCQGFQCCMDCIKFIIIAAQLYTCILTTDFGFKQVRWYFSGRRGAHCWVFDEEARTLDKENRMAIINYLSLQGSDFRSLNWSLKKHFYEKVFLSFFHLASQEELEMLGFHPRLIELKTRHTLLSFSKKVGLFEGGDTILELKHVFSSDLFCKMIQNCILIPDRSVSIDPGHLLRLPYSLNGDTGKVARSIDDINDLNRWISCFFEESLLQSKHWR